MRGSSRWPASGSGCRSRGALMVGDDRRADGGAAALGCAVHFVDHLPVDRAARRPVAGPGAGGGRGSGLVALDLAGGAGPGGVGVLPELGLGTALAQQVPALVQLAFEGREPGALGGGVDLPASSDARRRFSSSTIPVMRRRMSSWSMSAASSTPCAHSRKGPAVLRSERVRPGGPRERPSPGRAYAAPGDGGRSGWCPFPGRAGNGCQD